MVRKIPHNSDCYGELTEAHVLGGIFQSEHSLLQERTARSSLH